LIRFSAKGCLDSFVDPSVTVAEAVLSFRSHITFEDEDDYSDSTELAEVLPDVAFGAHGLAALAVSEVGRTITNELFRLLDSSSSPQHKSLS
jgi:hypothetical protein